MGRKTNTQTAELLLPSNGRRINYVVAFIASANLLASAFAINAYDPENEHELQITQAQTTPPIETPIEPVAIPPLPLEVVIVPPERDAIAELLPQYDLEEIVTAPGVNLPNEITVSRPGLDCATRFMIFNVDDTLINISAGTVGPRSALVDPLALATDGMEHSPVHHAESFLGLGIDHPRANEAAELVEEVLQIGNNLDQLCN